MKKRYLKKWVEYILLTIQFMLILIIGGECDNLSVFIISKLIALVLLFLNKELLLLLELIDYNKICKKYFRSSYEIDLYYKRLKKFNKIAIIDDSRKYYFPDYE